MLTGDDCISIGDYTSNIGIDNVECGPGHGIRFGLHLFPQHSVLSPSIRQITEKNKNTKHKKEISHLKIFMRSSDFPPSALEAWEKEEILFVWRTFT